MSLNRFILISLLLLLWVSCSKQQTSGTTSETTNGTIAGNIVSGSENAGARASVYLYSRDYFQGARENQEWGTTTDNSGDFSFSELNPGSYKVTVINEAKSKGATQEVELTSSSGLLMDNLDLDSLNVIYLLSAKNLPGVVTSIYLADLGYVDSVPEYIGQDTLVLAKLPKGEYSQIFVEIDGVMLPLLKNTLELGVGDTLWLEQELFEEWKQPYGYFALDYTDTNSYDTVSVSTYEELEENLAYENPLVVEVHGLIQGDENLNVVGGKKIIGSDLKSGINGFGLEVKGQRSVVIQNLQFINASENAVVLDGAKRVWIDHCLFKDARAELISVLHGADSISLSWNLFENQLTGILIGDDDENVAQDSGKFFMTFYCNQFINIEEQSPRIRFGTVHFTNNIWNDVTDYAIASTMGARVRMERNVFIDTETPTVIGYTSAEKGKLQAIDTELLRSGEIAEEGLVVFWDYDIPIHFIEWVQTTIPLGVGPTILP